MTEEDLSELPPELSHQIDQSRLDDEVEEGFARSCGELPRGPHGTQRRRWHCSEAQKITSIIIYSGLADREVYKDLLRTVIADQGVVDEGFHCMVVWDHFATPGWISV